MNADKIYLQKSLDKMEGKVEQLKTALVSTIKQAVHDKSSLVKQEGDTRYFDRKAKRFQEAFYEVSRALKIQRTSARKVSKRLIK